MFIRSHKAQSFQSDAAKVLPQAERDLLVCWSDADPDHLRRHSQCEAAGVLMFSFPDLCISFSLILEKRASFCLRELQLPEVDNT